MIHNLSERSIHQNWQSSLLFFIGIAAIHFTAAFLQSLILNFIGMLCFAIVSLVFVRKSSWNKIRILKPTHTTYLYLGLLIAFILVVLSFGLLYLVEGYGPANYFYVTARSQIAFGVINSNNAWQYFPIAAIGFSTLSPLTEELYFRGVLLTSFEFRLSANAANALQAIFFGFIHLAYMWIWELNLILFYSMIPIVALAGVLYGWVAQRTGSVFSSMLVHAFHNFLLILMVYIFIIPEIT